MFSIHFLLNHISMQTNATHYFSKNNSKQTFAYI
jgi:hypothetical protein